jgi:hypothetical protein
MQDYLLRAGVGRVVFRAGVGRVVFGAAVGRVVVVVSLTSGILGSASTLTSCDASAKPPSESAGTTTGSGGAELARSGIEAGTSASGSTGSASASRAREIPPRPLPKGEWGPIQVTSPLEVQQKALSYSYAMATPGPDDPPVDAEFLAALIKKLEPALRSADTGSKGAESVKPVQGDRKIELEMGGGCSQKTPVNVVAQRANIPLARLAHSGILAVQCHDARWKCIQSTREPDDVLCVVAPRH